jgi:hypothetical protein
MNAIRDFSVSAAICSPAADPAAAKLAQRMRNMQAFQEKYDAMLYVIEFIANYQCINTVSIRQQKRMAELRLLVTEARSKLKMLNSAG